jgi:hypothetical protein
VLDFVELSACRTVLILWRFDTVTADQFFILHICPTCTGKE